ncbi:MAG: ADP-ribosylglycohydrolase family protein [Clostridia bacterium]|nr:ADP-ribosylglycohydrolase family protein [Clostridia bacterium]
MKRTVALLLVLVSLLCACTPAGPAADPTDAVTTEAVVTTADPNAPDAAYPESEYTVLSKEDYYSKTAAGFLSQLVGTLSGFEFVTLAGGRCRVAMPDSWFVYCKGPYADPNPNKKHTDKHLLNSKTGIWEVWMDDDFSVDVFNQYMLADMYKSKKTVSQKYITDGWVKYDIYDMGGGQRSVGAYALTKNHNYLPQFAGNTEYGNWYSYCTEAYLGADTIGMNAAAMPETAAEMAGKFASVTGDRDNVMWAQMFAAMMSYAYFEDDIPTIIRKASAVFPEGSWPLKIVEDVFEFYEKYPDNWRTAYTRFESRHFVSGDTKNTDTDINCGFVLLNLLYGKGDYMETCKIGSLAGYDCESTVGISLSVLGIMQGMEGLPEDTNTLIWQDGKGVLTNLAEAGLDKGYWMIADALPDRIGIADVIAKYQQNFESVLLEMGGAMDDRYYYIPRQELASYSAVKLADPGFESQKLDAYTVTGDVRPVKFATTGFYAAQMKGESSLYTKVSGLEVGKTYSLTAFAFTGERSSLLMFARDVGGANATCVSVHRAVGTPKYEQQSTVKRTLVFTDTASEMEIGFNNIGLGDERAVVDDLTLLRINEVEMGTAAIAEPSADNKYKGIVTVNVNSTTAREAYLKVRFANTTGTIVDVAVSVNNRAYATAAFYKTYHLDSGMQFEDFVYIPVVLKEGENTVKLNTESKTVTIYDVSFIDIEDRWN